MACTSREAASALDSPARSALAYSGTLEETQFLHNLGRLPHHQVRVLGCPPAAAPVARGGAAAALVHSYEYTGYASTRVYAYLDRTNTRAGGVALPWVAQEPSAPAAMGCSKIQQYALVPVVAMSGGMTIGMCSCEYTAPFTRPSAWHSLAAARSWVHSSPPCRVCASHS